MLVLYFYFETIAPWRKCTTEVQLHIYCIAIFETSTTLLYCEFDVDGQLVD